MSLFESSSGEGSRAPTVLAEVHVYSKTELLKKYEIEHGEYIIGRDTSCHIVVEADEVSRHHARLSFSAYELVIQDLESSNGVFIDGVQVQIPTRLRHDQEVQIGAARIFVRLSATAAAQLKAALGDEHLGLAPMREMLSGQKYKIITTIGEGGMGVVMEGRDVRIRRTVAMKVMKTSDQFSRENVMRFVNEAQLTGQLEHPNIVPVYELGVDEGGEVFYTMKYVKGITLEDVLRSLRHGNAAMVAKYPLATLLTIFQKICDAVAFAHSKGVVHRDLKPDNVMIGAFGEVLVMDWGLAKNMAGMKREGQGIETEMQAESVPDGRGFQTMHGLIVGTPPYISPEQARGTLGHIDPRSDVYVLGELLYAILTLRPPFRGTTVEQVVEAIVASKIAPPSSFNTAPKSGARPPAPEEEELIEFLHLPGRRVPDGLSAVVMKAMQLAPADRYQSVGEMQADVSAHQSGFAPKAERASLRRHVWLWAGRHKREVALLAVGFIAFNVLVLTFVYRLTVERDRAKASEQRALESARLAAGLLDNLRGTAPTFFHEAQSLLEELSLIEALDRIDYAIEQVPNEPDYHELRGRILQSFLRWEEAEPAFEEALRRKPDHAGARRNLEFTRELNAQIKRAGDMTPAILRSFYEGLMKQDRIDEALGVLTLIPKDRELFKSTWRAVFDKRGIKQRIETNDDETLNVDFSRVPQPNVQKLEGAPVIAINLDDTRILDVAALRAFQLHRLSINRTLVTDLTPLSAMPLRFLSIDGTRVSSLAALEKIPLESLHLAGTPVADLTPLAGKKLDDLVLANCRNIRDLTPLRDVPLQRLDLSRTGVRDLAPLRGSTIRELNLEGCLDLIDLEPLAGMEQLETVIIPTQCKDIEFLRTHPALRRLSYKKLTQPVYEFWEEFDRKKDAPPAR